MAGIFAVSHYSNAAVKGDVNGDGSITAADVTAVYDYLLGNNTSDELAAAADVNRDGNVTAADITFIYDILLGNTPTEYEPVYIIGNVNGNEWATNNGVEMTTEDGNIYTATINVAQGFGYFSFTTVLSADADDWDAIAAYRFGATGESDVLVTEDYLGEDLPLTNNGYQAFKIAAGEFVLTLNMQEMTLKIEGEFAPQPQPEDNWYIIGSINEWSTSDMSYMFTQSAENENVYSIHIDNVSGDFWYKIANEDCYVSGDFWSGTILSAATDGEGELSGNLVLGNYGAFCIPASYNCTYLDITIDVENLTYTIDTDGHKPDIQDAADWYLVGTCNNWSATDMSYPFVQSAENENVYSIHVDNVSGDFWFKIAAGSNYSGSFWSGTFLSAAVDGESALSGNLVQGNNGAFCIPASYNCTYLDITIDVENLTYSITTDGQAI